MARADAVRSILITGASTGIGRATAAYFLEHGWNVGLMARRADLLQVLAAGRDNALVLAGDVTDEAAVAAAFAGFVDRFGRLDVLFNNAGVFVPGGTIDEIALVDWQTSVDVNLTGAFLCARAAFGVMRGQVPQGGRIINNGSISAHTPRLNSTPYTATKHAITGLTKSISVEGRDFDIACGQIDIGNAGTDMVTDLARRAAAADPEAAPEAVMAVGDVAKAVYDMADLPLSSNILFMTIMATKMKHIGRG
jgi:NAD(P)-dependent dehydrogenase (short-subunit alcohol dehydrogenase family)